MINKKVFFTVVLATFIALIATFIVFKQSAELKAMLNTPAAAMSLTTGTEVRRSIEDKQITLGKPIAARVIIEYKPKDNYSEKDVFDEIVQNLLDEHWQKEDLNTNQPGFFIASLSQDAFIIEAAVSSQPDRGIVSILLGTVPL